jgi:FkbM family methyltransferase
MRILKVIKRQFIKWTERSIKLTNPKLKISTERLGTDYGGWIIPTQILNENSICYLVGAGTDISFDLAVSEKYHPYIFILDPTPKAADYFKKIKNDTQISLEKIKFLKIGLWSENKIVRFFAPANPDHVSHSIVNLHKTSTYFDAPVKKLSDLMQENGHKAIDLLKIDIEGAEYEVIKSIVEDKISIGVICVEFDESARNHLDKNYIDRIEYSINSLEKIGFHVFEKEKGNYNFSLINPDYWKNTSFF